MDLPATTQLHQALADHNHSSLSPKDNLEKVNIHSVNPSSLQRKIGNISHQQLDPLKQNLWMTKIGIGVLNVEMEKEDGPSHMVLKIIRITMGPPNHIRPLP